MESVTSAKAGLIWTAKSVIDSWSHLKVTTFRKCLGVLSYGQILTGPSFPKRKSNCRSLAFGDFEQAPRDDTWNVMLAGQALVD